MAIFKRVAQITLSNIGGELDSVHAESTSTIAIQKALLKFVQNGVFETGDTIHIEEIETEIE